MLADTADYLRLAERSHDTMQLLSTLARPARCVRLETNGETIA